MIPDIETLQRLADLEQEVALLKHQLEAAPNLLAALIKDVITDSPDMWREVFAAIEKAEGRES